MVLKRVVVIFSSRRYFWVATKTYPAPNINSTEAEKPWCIESVHLPFGDYFSLPGECSLVESQVMAPILWLKWSAPHQAGSNFGVPPRWPHNQEWTCGAVWTVLAWGCFLHMHSCWRDQVRTRTSVQCGCNSTEQLYKCSSTGNWLNYGKVIQEIL